MEMERTGEVCAKQRPSVGLSEAAESVSVELTKQLRLHTGTAMHRGAETVDERGGRGDIARRCRTDGERSAPCTTIGGARVMCVRMSGKVAPRWAWCQTPTKVPGIRGFVVQPQTSPIESAGEGSELRLKWSERRPDVKAAGCRVKTTNETFDRAASSSGEG
ncbi:hypothetical protein Q8A73_004960 [Channa argus]|nr:hypothetical protein Q8A73_004960 [Channa argus]